MMVLLQSNRLFCFLLFTLGIYQITANSADWQDEFSLEQSWENQNILKLKGDLNVEEDGSNNQLMALREQPIKKSVVKRETPTTSGSAESGQPDEICTKKIDLGFVLDSSGSISSDDFDKMKSFVKDLTDHFEISQENTKVSVISYASFSTLHFPFSQQFLNREALHSAIDNIPYSGGGTNTAKALAQAYSEMFNSNNGARLSDAKKVLVVLTDGESVGSVDQPAQQLKGIGVTIFSIGVGSAIRVSELETMASSPASEHVYLLENFNKLSTLAEKMSQSTCNARSYRVLCGEDSITVVFGRHEVTSLDIDNMYLADRACKASYNQTHVYVTTPLNGCGNTYSQTEREFFYNNTLTAAVPISPGSVITRKQSLAFAFKCTYSRLLSVSGLKFEPPNPVITVEESDLGNFTVNLGTYPDAGFLSSTSEKYPAFKSFEDRIHIQYGLNTSNTDIVVRAETCRATPSSKPYDTPQYEFISEACDKDSTIIHHTTGLQQSHRFSIQVFRFVANHTFVYIHCDLRLCNINTQDSVCARSTTCSNRKRRDASDATERSYQLSIGPIMYREKIKEESNKDQDDEAESSPNTIMIAILVCAGLIVLLLTATVVFLVRKRRAKNSTKSLEVIPMQYPSDKMMAFGNGNMAEN